MSSQNNVIQWLHYHYEFSSTNDVCSDLIVTSEEIKIHLGKQFTNTNVGYYMKHAFPGVVSKQVRMEGNWAKKHLVYLGVQRRGAPIDVNFLDIPTQLPHDFFVLHKSGDEFVFGKDSGLLSLGNRLLIETTVNASFNVNVKIQGKKIDNANIGLMCQLQMDSNCIDAMFCTIRNIKLCENLEITLENVSLQKQSKCLIVLPIQGTSFSICKNCRAQSRQAESATVCDVKSLIKSSNQVSETNSCAKNVSESSSPTPNALSEITKNTCNCNSEHTNVPSLDSFDVNSSSSSNMDSVLQNLKSIAPNISVECINLLKAQIINSNAANIHGRRWDSDIIQLCLSIWNRSPKAYDELCASEVLLLPSTRTLSSYKNTVKQKPGINEDHLHWMYLDAYNRNLPENGYHGGLVFDEMAIQNDLQIQNKKLVGLSDLGSEGNKFEKGDNPQIANHVLQFIFHGFSGFRFLVAQFPTTTANSNQLYSVFWDVVNALARWEFHVHYACYDGASTNRVFTKMNFEKSPLDHDMAAINIVTMEPLYFLADPSHIFKKIRNNILSSGMEKWHARLLKKDGNIIKWSTFIKCYTWDKSHGLAIHQRLTYEHLYPNAADKMRNHLAEEILNKDMLHMMSMYLQNNPKDAEELAGPIELLHMTSTFIDIFHDRRPILDSTDQRLKELKGVFDWFKSWELSSEKCNLMSAETREDILWLLSGFQSLCLHVMSTINHQIVPAFINSDIIENVFSQQRGIHHGAGSNPNYQQYCYAVNAITIGQTTISKKANAARRKSSTFGKGAVPYQHLCKKLKLWYAF